MMLERGFRISGGFVNQVAVTAQYVSKLIQYYLNRHLASVYSNFASKKDKLGAR